MLRIVFQPRTLFHDVYDVVGSYPADLVTVVRWPPASERAWWQLVVRLVGHERDNAPSVAAAEIDAVPLPDERGCWHVDDQFHNDSTLNFLHTQYSCVSVGFLSERKTVESILAERYYVMFGHWHRNSVCRLWRWCNLLTAVNFSHHCSLSRNRAARDKHRPTGLR